MSDSSHRDKAYRTYHHIVSRIAHRVFFLTEDERNDFIDRMRRVAVYTGIELVGWCVMTNHFHILAYLPEPLDIDEQEVLRRYGVLKGAKYQAALAEQFDAWRRMPACESLVEVELNRLRAQMYSIGWFMKILKQWTTQDYNRRYSHKGTLWESAYRDRIVRDTFADKVRALGYIHLNPVRAAASAGFDDYRWSSLTAFRRGDPIAVAGMRHVYSEEMSVDNIADEHIEMMEKMLGEMRWKRAIEIARRRAAGYEAPADPLTDEAMVAQALAHLDEVQHAGTELHEERAGRGRRWDGKLEESILSAITATPKIGGTQLASLLSRPPSSVYFYLDALQKRGVISRANRASPWLVNSKK